MTLSVKYQERREDNLTFPTRRCQEFVNEVKRKVQELERV
jgi:hypothetical protein